MGNLKDYREKELTWYIITNILILLLLSGIFDIHMTKESIELVTIFFGLLYSAVLSAVFYCFILVVESLFSSGTKDKVLYMRQNLPGETAFSEMNEKNVDKRFTKEDVLKKYSEIYDQMPQDLEKKRSYENSNWYKIYKKHRTEPMIEMSHREYLLCRDLFITTAFMIFLYSLLTLLFQVIEFEIVYLIYLVIMLVITYIGAHQKGKKFVYDVIASDL
ncbi:hypothetical protein [Methanolapillus ohkumae]|uniref:Uncharacterized protein n=1 Tax=Methanolapillus ohkumae TaxID=3028298 RepID=A0AA96V6X3_9EURY|nr:hypothetical protein MsAm2_04570 [Methanosarcinaceae archaeon Am2]